MHEPRLTDSHPIPLAMVFPNVDPVAMMLPGFFMVLVNGREKYLHIIMARERPGNEDLAIITVSHSKIFSFRM